MNRFVRSLDFHALSLQDLAEARDAYHVHLANLPNVVGTALGRYLVRRSDPRFENPNAEAPGWWSKEPRRLDNSGITKWSWPCVLVFVRRWMENVPDENNLDQVIPKRLYLPDGRQVPTCVVLTEVFDDLDRESQIQFGSITLGPGLPLFAEQQERRRMGTIGAMVTDGSRTYALTSRHTLGPSGTSVMVADRGSMVTIGQVTKTVDRRPVKALYPGIAATRAQLDIDAGLIELDELGGWTSQLYGLGVPGELIDINVNTIGLSLIGCPVKAHGAASGLMEGAVLGLFHRWRSVGGVDQIAELMIGPRKDAAAKGRTIISRPGDSGAVWVWDEGAEATAEGGQLMMSFQSRSLPVVSPFAMQWGGQVVLDASGGQPAGYVLASTMASVAATLEISLLTDDTFVDHSLYWGKVGHYKIAQAACRLGEPGTKFAKLLAANADRIAISDDVITSGEIYPHAKSDDFVALADVPDIRWRWTRPKDAGNHFADMDEPGGQLATAADGSVVTIDHKTLMELWDTGDPLWRTPMGWELFYNSLATPPELKHRGALPFRVAQLYALMVDAVQAKDMLTYIAAAGVLAHYVGDACQPLHSSRLHDGDPEKNGDRGVHSAYETTMLDRYAPEVVTGVNATLGQYHVGRRGSRGGPRRVAGPEQAADEIVKLMKRSVAAISPIEIIEAYRHPGAKGKVKTLWDKFGEKTIQRLADGARTLAVLWHSAWIEGGGEDLRASLMVAQSQAGLIHLYEESPDFAPATWLRDWDAAPYGRAR